ncbi:Zn(2+)-responsive transcriptional regulator [Neptunicella marina]|uniref:Zn(2+)-responsive transcriptional regulator n=2 Tax=Neptunicella marina TaxID=2125989 RepID=A0A8J6IUC9_9ALTE|nr:Zn(2+)-responsive transcriptional regulator [Neptunicella marina]MBC3765957.1 Zn(2+)-responsive transcriptional regulator [Neptunicella marina]
MQSLQIGELAKQAGISVDTLRFYESKGLVKASERSEGGYRLYSQADSERLNFILQAKKVGFSLKEIQQLLTLDAHKDQHTCNEVKQVTGQKIEEIEQKIHDLVVIKQALQHLHQACCGGPESAENCTILQSLQQTKEASTCNG